MVDQVEPTQVNSTLRMLIRLWSHESTRVYLDRNIDSKERIWFLKVLESCIKYCFCGVGFEGSVAAVGGMPAPRQTGGHTANLGELTWVGDAIGPSLDEIQEDIRGWGSHTARPVRSLG
jgi:hypothetical protein